MAISVQNLSTISTSWAHNKHYVHLTLIDWCLMPPLAIFHLYYGIHVCPHYMNDKDDKKL